MNDQRWGILILKMNLLCEDFHLKYLPREQINFEMLHISKLICRKMRFFAVSTLCYGALHSRAALDHLNCFKVKLL